MRVHVGLCRATLARALAGLGLQPGTVAMIRTAIASEVRVKKSATRAKPGTRRAGRPEGVPLEPGYRTSLEASVKQLGEVQLCARLGISAPTLARALAGVGIDDVTRRVIQAAIHGVG